MTNRLLISLAAAMLLFIAASAAAGPYRDSAHGDSGHGVDRSSIEGALSQYSTGNCAHCHEMHASIEGAESGASSHMLFAESFNTTRTQNQYMASDNFCFSCHSEDLGPQVTNQDYSATFGGAATGSGPQSILAAFNQASYHNLFDIWTFLSNDPAFSGWFADIGNPCSACHNSHLAKRNWDSGQIGFPLLSAVSKPLNHDSLWGEAELMAAYSYEAPYAFGLDREPAGVGEADGSKTPDYVGFCTACHDSDKAIASTTLNRYVKKIDWRNSGLNPDKHGASARDGENHLREPYAAAAGLKSNFVLSCLDCHESHGSDNIQLLRRRINGEDLEGVIASTDSMSYACKRCHEDDLAAAAGTGQANRWEYVHHNAVGAPYAKSDCIDCHAAADGSTPIACGNCHGHGMDDSWAGTRMSGRKTF